MLTNSRGYLSSYLLYIHTYTYLNIHLHTSFLYRVIVAITSAIGDFNLQENADSNYSSAVHAKCLLCDKPVLGNIHTYIHTYTLSVNRLYMHKYMHTYIHFAQN